MTMDLINQIMTKMSVFINYYVLLSFVWRLMKLNKNSLNINNDTINFKQEIKTFKANHNKIMKSTFQLVLLHK